MKNVRLALMLVLSTPLAGCGGLAPDNSDPGTGTVTSAFSFPFWNVLQPCPTDWIFNYCFTPDGQTVTDISYLRTDLICGWTQPYHFGCSLEGRAESVGQESNCMPCQTASGVKWTSLRYPWYHQAPVPTDAQILANPNGYNAYGAYGDGSGYWDFVREDYALTGDPTSGYVVYTWTDTGKRMSAFVISTFTTSYALSGTWSVSGSVVTLQLWNSNGTFNSTKSYTYIVDNPNNYQLRLTDYPADGTPTRYFIRPGA